MKAPLVSVDMITYNHKPYIVRAIEGILQQKTNFPFEIVIGEDCSTDGTREIVFEYQRKYPDIIRVVTSDKNIGAKENVYRTAKACRGKYVADCEGDDYWHDPDKLQKQVDYMDSHPECGLVFTDFDIYDVKSGRRIRNYNRQKKPHLPKNPDICDIVRGRGGILGGMLSCTTMSRRKLLEQVIESDPYLYRDNVFALSDTQLYAEVAHLSGISYIEDSTATHNLLCESATRSRDVRKRLRFLISATEMLLYLCDKYNLPADIRQIHETNWCDYASRLAFYECDAGLAEKVKKRKAKFTFSDWLKYFGSRNLVLHYVLKPIVYCKNQCLFRNTDTWFRPSPSRL